MEFLITCVICFLSVAVNLELVAKARSGLMLHHLSFHYLRYRALGSSKEDTRSRLTALVGAAFGKIEGKRIKKIIRKAEEQRQGSGRGYLEAAISYKYAPIVPVPFKQSFQVVRRCKFPY